MLFQTFWVWRTTNVVDNIFLFINLENLYSTDYVIKLSVEHVGTAADYNLTKFSNKMYNYN